MLKRIASVLALFALGLVIALFAVAYRGDIPAEELERRYTDGDSQFLDIAGSRVHVKDVGSRDLPPLVLIHGTASSLHTWDGWADALGDRHRVVRLDLPGYGLTGPNDQGPEGRGDYSTRYRLEVIDGLLDALGVDKFYGLGHSCGGVRVAASSTHV
ncbi:MAG: alpha/beta fold hydrolase, partial [Acidobacteriota bacterium]